MSTLNVTDDDVLSAILAVDTYARNGITVTGP